MGKGLLRTLFYALLIGATLVMLFPFFYMFVTAAKDETQLISTRFFPSPWHLENFWKGWTQEPFTLFLMNSTVVAVAVTGLTLLLGSMGGFAFAKFQFRGKELVFLFVLSTMMVPYQVTMIPNFLLCGFIGILNSYIGLVVPCLPLAFGIFLMRQFITTIPTSLIEAARIDGSSDVRVFFQIVLPLCKPALATLAIFTFMASWNNFIWPLIILDSESMYTIPIGLLRFNQQYETQHHYMMAVSLLSILPIVILFISFQRAFVKGMALTGLKE